ncbi:GPI ethanolamine phosphate transferase 1 [Fusarium oxysporum f. sp. albedinis]|nr:GPI ethanolamine phosphate transferase 1 [Fusarium oxysporum f. sp. albedinis]
MTSNLDPPLLPLLLAWTLAPGGRAQLNLRFQHRRVTQLRQPAPSLIPSPAHIFAHTSLVILGPSMSCAISSAINSASKVQRLPLIKPNRLVVDRP